MQGLIAAGLGLALCACEADPRASDLNTEGPPRVITVTVLSEFAWFNLGIVDIATYCADPETEKLNANYCPPPEFEGIPADAVAAALPIGWEIRVVFNELLNPSVENLLPCVDGDHDGVCTPDSQFDTFDVVNHGSLIATQPVTLMCNGEEIPYDGYYQPAGNHLTVPPGPALIIEPIFPNGFAATGSTCQVTVKPSVQGKDGEGITQAGPYMFQIAPMDYYETDPAEGATIAVSESVKVTFNAYVDEASLASTVSVTDDTGADFPVTVLASGDTVEVVPSPGAWDPGTDYTLTIGSGVQDIKGGTYNGTVTLNFSTQTP